jgi:phage-related holin
MKEIWNKIQVALTMVGGFVGWFLGGVDGFLYALITFVVIDYKQEYCVQSSIKTYAVRLVLKVFLKRYLFLYW